VEVKPGYKQTEVGIIPEEWELKCIKDIAPLQRGFDLPASKIRKGPYPVVYSNGVLAHHLNFLVKGPGVVTGRSGTIGNVHFVEEDFWPHNTSLWVTSFKGNDPKFVFYLLQTIGIDRFSTGSGVPTLNRNDVHSHRVAIPPSAAEQRAIAAAIGDADALIAGLDKIIAKKRDLKKAAMQQLLTGQTRLPGFSGEWEVKRLGDVAEIVSGGTPRTSVASYWDGSIKWCTPTDITGTDGRYLSETARTISQAGLDSCSAQLLPAGALLLCSRATIGELRIAACDVCTNQGFKSLIAKEGVSNEYLYYLLLKMKPQLVERAIGSTFLEISKKDTASFDISLPLFDEQTAIATVLSDTDAEIAALEARRNKTRALKQGMMQELLTGRTRLI
jgi:type I restriction enzyme S subunit